MEFLRLLFTMFMAFLVGKLVTKLRLPAILGWLITGMALGPYALSVIDSDMLNSYWYLRLINVLECSVGIMIGRELVLNKLKKSGKSIVIITIFQSLFTFCVVSLVFGICFYMLNIPLYLAFIFGGIALATAPAPALSIVKEFHTKGAVTDTLIPMAALDDIVGCIVFFTTIAVVSGNLSAGSVSTFMVVLIIILPLVVGAILGIAGGFILRKDMSKNSTLLALVTMIVIVSLVGFLINDYVFHKSILNFMLMGMAFSAVFSNMVGEKRLNDIMSAFNPILYISILAVILNLGTPLDYHLVLGAGVFTVIYIVSRALGKYFGAYFGSTVARADSNVKKYLGLTLLPHSGVSLVFAGLAVSMLINKDPESAKIIQGTIAAAAVINEIIAVILAQKGFSWAKEIGASNTN